MKQATQATQTTQASPSPTRDNASRFVPTDLESLEGWVAKRLAALQNQPREGVRVPVFKRPDAATCACPPFALGVSPDSIHLPIRLVDLTSIGTAAYAEDGALLWVEGRFTAGDDPLSPQIPDADRSKLPTLEVVRASKRTRDEPAPFELLAAP